MQELKKQVQLTNILIAAGLLLLFLFLPLSLAQLWLSYKIYAASANHPTSGYYRAEHKEFRDKASDLLSEENYRELLKHASDQALKRPNDPYAYYYIGLAHYYLGEHREAIENLKKASALAPYWKPETTGAYISKAEEALGQGGR